VAKHDWALGDGRRVSAIDCTAIAVCRVASRPVLRCGCSVRYIRVAAVATALYRTDDESHADAQFKFACGVKNKAVAVIFNWLMDAVQSCSL